MIFLRSETGAAFRLPHYVQVQRGETMIYLIGETGAAETNDEKYAQTLESYAYYRRCTEEEHEDKLLEIEALDNAEVDQSTCSDKVFLQIRDEDGDTPDEVTWCVDRIHDTDVEYVLASEARAALESMEAMRDKWRMDWETTTAQLGRTRAERDTLAALVPLYRAVDDLLYHAPSNGYPKGYWNRDRLPVLRETFLGMSIDAVEEPMEIDLKEESDEAVV